MGYVSIEQYNEAYRLRETIDGELNRIAVTDDIQEIKQMARYLQINFEKYVQKHIDRVNGVYNSDWKNVLQNASADDSSERAATAKCNTKYWRF